MKNFKNSSASYVMFGWDFQINAAIYLALDCIKKMKYVKVEGENEDIEISLNDGKFYYIQAKSHTSPLNIDGKRKDKLRDALRTLSNAYKNNQNVQELIYVSNLKFPLKGKFNEYSSFSYYFFELDDESKKEILSIISDRNLTINTDLLKVQKIQFAGMDTKTRYHEVSLKISEFLNRGLSNIDTELVYQKLQTIWQEDFFFNASVNPKSESKTITKDKLFDGVIYSIFDNQWGYTNEIAALGIDPLLESKVRRIYTRTIFSKSNNYEISMNIINGFKKEDNKHNIQYTDYINNFHKDFLSSKLGIDHPNNEEIALAKIIMKNVLVNHNQILSVKGVMGL